MRILIVHPWIFNGGAERVVLLLANHLTGLGNEVAVATVNLDLSQFPDWSRRIRFLSPQGDVGFAPEIWDGWIFRNGYPLVPNLKMRAKQFLLLSRIVAQYSAHFDVVNPHGFPASWCTSLFAGRPIVWYCYEPPWVHYEEFFGWSANRVGMFRLFDRSIVRKRIRRVAVSDELNKQRIWSLYGLSSTTIHLPLDIERYAQGRRKNIRSDLGLSPDDFVVLQVGNLSAQKNQISTIRALSKVRKELSTVKLVIAGSGRIGEQLKAEVRRLGLEDYVLFAGQLTEERLLDFYYSSNLNVFPAIRQTWGLAPLEALIFGKPSIVSDSCGVCSFMRKHDACVMARSSQIVPDLASGILQVNRNYDLFRDKCVHAKQRIVAELHPKRFAAKLLEIFESCVR